MARRCNPASVQRVRVEVYAKAHELNGSGEQRWNPRSRESADHSIPYVVAATLLDGTITRRSFNDAHLNNAQLRTWMQKVEVVASDEFTRAYEGPLHEHHARVTVLTDKDERFAGESGGEDDLSAPKTDAQIEQKFRMLTEDVMGQSARGWGA